ncbi:MAG: dockerin type I domain-containing protein [Phycisphaerales bacterium]|nr:dockerin type I domain-containing protein [Phycisphaerales bacterium]
MLGDVVVASSHTPDVTCPTVQVLDVDCIGVLSPWDFDLTIGVSNMDPTTSITSVTMTSPTGTTLTPDHVTMSLPPLHSWSFDTVLEGAAQGSTVCIDLDVAFSNGDICTETICIDLPNCIIVLPGDLDANGLVDIDDLIGVINRWADVCDDANANCDGADVNENGEVDMADLLIVISNWSL